MREEIDPVVIKRAMQLAERGIPIREVAETLGVSRAALYLYGVRSARGYIRNV